MAALGTTVPTLLDLAKRTDPNGAVAKVIEILDQSSELLPILPFISMKTSDDKLVPWLASQTDVLAEDWSVVKGE